MPQARTIAKWSLLGIAGLLAVAAIALAVGFAWLRSEDGRDWLARQIEDAASTPGKTRLAIGELTGDLPQSIELRDIVLSDTEGPWLTIQALRLDWRPWQLLSRRLEVERLSLGHIELARLPAGRASEPDDAGAGGTLGMLRDFPLKVRIDRFAADEIALGEPVLGEPARFTLAGEAGRRDDGSLSLQIDLRRIDGADGWLAAALRYQPQSDSLTADIEAEAAPGGLLAAMLDMPDLPGADLKLAGSGPLADWSGDFTLSLGTLAEAQADIGLQRTGGGDLAFRLQGGADIRPPQESDLWGLVAGHSDIALQGAWQDSRRLHLDQLTVAGSSLRLGLAGDVVPASGALDLKLSLAADDAAALAAPAGLGGLQAFAADVAVQGTLDRPQARLDLRAAGIASAALAMEAASLTGSVVAERDLLGPDPLLALDLEARLDSLRLPGQDALNQVLGDSLPVSLAGRLDPQTLVLEIAQLAAATDSARVAASGPVDLSDGGGELDAVAEVADLGILRPLTAIALGGRARLAGPVILSDFGSRVAADLTGRWEQPASEIGLIDAAAGDGLDLAVRLAIEDGEVRVEQATARSPTTELEASLTVAGGGLRDGRYSLAIADAAALAGELGVATTGAVAVRGRIAGPFDALELNGQAELARLTVQDQVLSDLSGTYRLTVSGAEVAGPVEVALTTPFGPAEAATRLEVGSAAVTLAELHAELARTTVGGRLVLPLDGGAPVADLTGEVADLGPWLQVAGLSGGGNGRIAVTLNKAGAAAPLTASASFSDLTLRPAPGATPVTAEELTLTVQGADAAFTKPGRIEVEATSLQRDRLALARVDAAARGTLDAMAVTLDTAGRWIQPLELAAEARVTQQDGTVTVALERAQGKAFGQPLALHQPATLVLAPRATRLEGLVLSAGDARLTADAALGEGRIMVEASVDALPLKIVDAFWDSGLAGRLTAEVSIEGATSDPRGSARLVADGLRPRDSQDVPELQLTAEADWRNGRVRVDGALGGDAVAAARFSADAPLRMSADGGFHFPRQEALSARLDWSGGIRPLLLFAPLPQHRLSGQAEVAISVDGTLAAPRATGRVALTHGHYENLENGTILRDLAFTAEVSEEQVTLASLTANDGAGGKVHGTGSLAIDPDRSFPFDATITLDKFYAVRRDDVTAVTSGKVTLDGNAASPQVTGRFTTETVEISLLTELPPNVVSLDVIEVKNGQVKRQSQKADEPPPVDVALDVVVEIPRRVFVRGRGLDSEWAGRISVQGSSSAPAVSGSLNLVRGQLSVVGKPFILKSGKVTLPEGADTEPTLDVTAVHEGSDLTVTARLSGPVSQPELTLSSVPPVPRDEIVSRVLFDKSAAELSAVEAAQLAIALRDLTGKGGGADILGFARRTLGVDVLRIETAEGDAPAVEAGRYLTDKVYVGVQQGTGAQSSSASVEVELTPNITVESEVTARGTNRSGVRFQLDY